MSEVNKRLAKNTLFLYFRMGIIMLVSLYTSRIVLAELGIDDYGVFMVVGGVVMMFSFLNNSMTTSTQRFLNYELGRMGSTEQQLRNVFSTALSIHITIAIMVVVAAETLGLWFVNTKLVIPHSTVKAANIIYQASILSFCITIIQAPFNAAIIAHERMKIYAIVSIIEALLKLLIAYALILIQDNRLIFYGIMVLLVHVITASIYISICIARFKECIVVPSYIPSLYKEMSKFAGWNMFGSIAWLIRGQGMGIILNMFFGPALNAAKGVSDQVSSAVQTLSNNFQIALNPQITKNYAAQRKSEMEILAYRGIKFSSMLIWLMALPIILNSSIILHIWLEDVPPYSKIFVILILVDCFSGNLFGTPLMTSLAATGKIKIYQITVSTILLMILPSAYFVLRLGFPPESIFYLNIIFNIFSGIARFLFCKVQIRFSIRQYLIYAFLPTVTVVLMSTLISYICKAMIENFINSNIEIFIISSIISIIMVGLISWYIGMNKTERLALKKMLKDKVCRNGKNL